MGFIVSIVFSTDCLYSSSPFPVRSLAAGEASLRAFVLSRLVRWNKALVCLLIRDKQRLDLGRQWSPFVRVPWQNLKQSCFQSVIYWCINYTLKWCYPTLLNTLHLQYEHNSSEPLAALRVKSTASHVADATMNPSSDSYSHNEISKSFLCYGCKAFTLLAEFMLDPSS